MVAWVKALLFVIGGVTAAAGTAYVTGLLDPWLGRGPAVVASLPQTQSPSGAPQSAAPAQDGQSDGDASDAAGTDEVPLPGDATTTDKQARLAEPTFDLLRVEPDGSVVIAGKGVAGSQIEIIEGDKVIAKADANAEGDFVAVLDEPLKPGDYQLNLRATLPDSDVAVSAETAIVSVPETPDGQVLAMVEQPGAPAQLITVPEATGDAADADAASEQQPEQREAPPAAAAGASTGQDAASAEAGAAAGASTSGDAQVAAAPPADDSAASSEQQPATGAVVAVEAVEIEGDTIFVAGVAEPGRTVRVYADEILLGDARASEGGRFLVEARRELAVGNYVIRADLLDEGGSVVARAAVPFEREPGESIAAVAPPAQQQSVQNDAPSPLAEAGQDTVAAAPPASAPVTQAPAQGEGASSTAEDRQPATGNQPAAPAPADGQAASGTDTEIAVAAEAEGGEEGLTAPKLQRVDGAVIIRRGDSLWRISRRVYGMGVRYSTIYLANQDQIRNPDRIWPGQVFSVPRETAEGEAADMDAIGEQSVLPENGAASTNR